METKISGVLIKYDKQTRRIYWTDCWERIPQLAAQGLLLAIDRCYYNATAYYVKQ